MGLEIIRDKAVWDSFVDSSYNGTLFHKWDFLKTAEKHTSTRLYTYGILKGDELIGLFPVFVMKKYSLKFAFTSPPKTGMIYSGVVLTKEFPRLKRDKKDGILEKIADSIDYILNENSPQYFHMNLAPPWIDVREFVWRKYNIVPRYTYILDLTRSIDKLWGLLKKETRRKIKKIRDSNTITFERVENLESIYKIIRARYNALGLATPIINSDYLSELQKNFPNNIEGYLIRSKEDNSILTGQIIVKYRNRFITWMGGTKITSNTFLPDYIMWKFIEMAKLEGFEVFDFGGANTKRLIHFKSKFNPNLELHFEITKKSAIGKLSELAYKKVLKKRWW